MKTCFVCGKLSVMQEFVWKKNKPVLIERCCNPFCKTYKPYVWWNW